MPMVDALAVWAEEGRVFKRENNDESLNRRYQSLVSEWGNPFLWKQREPALHREIPITKLQETNNNQFSNFNF